MEGRTSSHPPSPVFISRRGAESRNHRVVCRRDGVRQRIGDTRLPAKRIVAVVRPVAKRIYRRSDAAERIIDGPRRVAVPVGRRQKRHVETLSGVRHCRILYHNPPAEMQKPHTQEHKDAEEIF